MTTMERIHCDYAIEAKGLCKSFDDFQLQNISFSLPCGTIMGLIGENGAGKTTTLKLLLGMLRREQGSVRLLNLLPEENEAEVKAHTGTVLAQGFFYEELSPKQMNTILRRCHPFWDEAYFLQLLKQFGLPLQKRYKDMSQGMRAKLKLAAAMAPHPQLLLLDEPTSGLDPVARSQFLDLLLEFIQDETCSILLSSHITSDLEKVADYTAYLHQGRLLFCEETSLLLEHYAVVRCGWQDFQQLLPEEYVSYRKNAFGCDVLIRDRNVFSARHPEAVLDPASLETIMTLYAERR